MATKELSDKAKFILTLQDKHYEGTITDWYFRGGDLYGKYFPTNVDVIYGEEYIEKLILEEDVVVLTGSGYIRLEHPLRISDGKR